MFKWLEFLLKAPTETLRTLRLTYALLRMMNQMMNCKFITIEEHHRRVTELLVANNKGVMERRELVKALEGAEEIINHQTAVISAMKEAAEHA